MDTRYEFDSPFLIEELFTEDTGEELGSRASMLASESAFQGALEFPEEPDMEAREQLEDSLFSERESGVIDGDNRVRISKTDAVPWRWICKISVLDQQGRYHSGGTGVLVSARHVLTSAHVVYPEFVDPYNYSLEVIPALNDEDAPFGSYSVSDKPKIAGRYNPQAKDHLDWDYALLTLNDRVGDKAFPRLDGKPLCYWGRSTCGQNAIIALPEPATLNAKAAVTAGYPEGKGGKELWCAAGMLHSAMPDRRTMRITADTTKGQSGSPVWVTAEGTYRLVGIAAGAGANSNTVVRVTREVMDQVRKWIREDGDTPAIEEEFTDEPAAAEAEYDPAELYQFDSQQFESEEFEEGRAWKKTNIQFRVLNYLGNPMEHYLLTGYILDARTGEKVMLGSGPIANLSTGTTGVLTFPRVIVPAEGTLVLHGYPDYYPLPGGVLRAKGQALGDLSGSVEWKRTRPTMMFKVAQKANEIEVWSRGQTTLEETLRGEGKIGIVLGPVQADASGSTESRTIEGGPVEYKFKVKIPDLTSWVIEPTGEESEASDFGEESAETWPGDDDPAEDKNETPILEGQAPPAVEKPRTFGDALSLTAPVASCVSKSAPAHPPFRECKYYFQIIALDSKGFWGNRGSSELWFLLSFDYNGADLNDVQILAMADSSTPIHHSDARFSIEFSSGCNDSAGSVAEIRFKIAGRWKSRSHGSSEVSFWGHLLVRADGSAKLHIESEDDSVLGGIFKGSCPRKAPPGPAVLKPSWTLVYFSPSGSWTLSKAERDKLSLWWNKLPGSVRDRVVAGQISVNLHGYASTKGATRSNRILSKKRAEEVREILMGDAGSKAEYRIFPHGEDRADTPDRVESLKERRVSVSVFY